MQFCISYWINYFKLACCLENSVDPDQLASEEGLSCALFALWDKKIISLLNKGLLLKVTCFIGVLLTIVYTISTKV